MSHTQRPPEAFRSPELFEVGMGYVIVSRFKSGGRVEMGVFLVDVFCLGVKDAFFYPAETLSDYKETLEKILPGKREKMPPAAARKLVEQAVAYAAKLGFSPAADYKKGARVFGGIHAEDWPGDFTFGKNGKPFFMNGPEDTPERCQKIIGVLERSCGPGNYDCTIVEGLGDIVEEFEEVEERASKGLEKMAEDFQKRTGRAITISNPAGLPKLSDQLGELLLPFMTPGKDLEEVRGMYEIAALAWNFPMLPWYKRMFATFSVRKMAGPDAVDLFKALVVRRFELFPDDRRRAVKVEVNDAGIMGLDVRVAYAINPKDLPEGVEIPAK